MALILSNKITKINKNSRVQKETECTYNVFMLMKQSIFNLIHMELLNEKVNQNQVKQFSLTKKQQNT